MTTIELNLASRPVRNRRLYAFVGSILLAGIIGATILAVFFAFRFSGQNRTWRSRLAEIERHMTTAEREERQLVAKTREAAKKNQEKVDLVNSLIWRKSFSWTEFLSRMEESLPPSSYVLALDQQNTEEGRARFRLRVASRTLEDLLTLITNLQSRHFGQIRVESEEKNPQGQFVYEIMVSYEPGDENPR